MEYYLFFHMFSFHVPLPQHHPPTHTELGKQSHTPAHCVKESLVIQYCITLCMVKHTHNTAYNVSIHTLIDAIHSSVYNKAPPTIVGQKGLTFRASIPSLVRAESMNTSLKWGQLVPLLPTSSGHDSSAHCKALRPTSSDVGHVLGVVRGSGRGAVGCGVAPPPLARREVKDSVMERSVCLCLTMSTCPPTHQTQ